FNTVNSIETFTDVKFSAEQGEDGYLKLLLEEGPSSDAELLLQSLLLGLSSIQEEYGEKHIKIRFEEV
ncbi:MAG: ribosomal-processing cysteine protease Prp, partial [Lachnospiraceae bacterium]|nr:ribosomal-processing cysteine protease Prp [Lachnospiraceae bacterium]